MRLHVLGSNGTYPTPGRPASGYLVVAESTAVLLDCGPGVFPALLATGVVPDAIVLTHRHSDHCLDVISLFNWLRFDAIDRWGIPVLAPQGVMSALAAMAGAGPDHDFHRALPERIVDTGDRVDVGAVTLEFGRMTHPVRAVGVRVAADDTTLTYSGDTGPGGDLIALADGTDLLLCEATLQGIPGTDRYPFHLHATEAGAIARDAGVGRLLVTHLGPSLDPEVSVAEAATTFAGSVAHAAPGLEVSW